MASNHYEHDKLFWRFHLQNADQNDTAGNNSSMESDSKDNQWNQAKGLPVINDIEAKSSFIKTSKENKR